MLISESFGSAIATIAVTVAGLLNPAPPEPEVKLYKNCTELRKDFPKGVPADHSAYRLKLDRDKDGTACELV